MNLKKLAGKFPNDDHLITSMAITMAVRKTKATNANIIYSRHFQVDLPCHGIPSGVGSQHSSMLGDSGEKRITSTKHVWKQNVQIEKSTYTALA